MIGLCDDPSARKPVLATGVFAPSLVVGGGLGAAFAIGCKHIFPHLVSDPAFYSLVAMAGVFGCIARAPFISIVFLLELSHDPNSLLPLIVCVMIADGVVRLFSRDSIMTVKLVKRGLIVLQDYWVPVLMRARIDQVMRTEFPMLQGDEELRKVITKLPTNHLDFMPIIDGDGKLMGIVEPHDLLRIEPPDHHFTMKDLAHQDYVLAFPGETADRVQRKTMLNNVENAVVVRSNDLRPVGVVRASDILQLRRWLVEEETGALRRETLDKPAESPGIKLD